MKAVYLIIFAAYFTSNAHSRLIEKNTEKQADTEPTESPTPVRVSRQVYYEDGTGISKEDNTQEEDLRTYVRKGRYSMKSKSSNTRATNIPKDTSDTVTKKHIEIEEGQTKSTKALIKKPIPKFNEVDYEDFQGKVNKSPVKFADSGEHEDEDFNLDDYEFDVNHDEFIGRGKPLEPRTKVKEAKAGKTKKSLKPKPTLPPPEIKIQSKVIIPTEQTVSARKIAITKKAADKMKEDYYDDVVTTTKVPETETKRDLDDEFPEDTEDSKEFNRKNPTRVARSPWLVKFLGDRMGERPASLMTKLFNTLPIMPRGTGYYGVSNDPEGIARDPFTGREFFY